MELCRYKLTLLVVVGSLVFLFFTELHYPPAPRTVVIATRPLVTPRPALPPEPDRVAALGSLNILQRERMLQLLQQPALTKVRVKVRARAVTRSRSRVNGSEVVVRETPPRPTTDFMNVVHFVWCEKRVFEFQHYLSLKSVIQYLQADRIVFHYTEYPHKDKYLYNTWFDELQSEWPFIELRDLGKKRRACDDDHLTLGFVRDVLGPDGGVFVQRNTIFTRAVNFTALMTHGVVYALSDSHKGFLIAQGSRLKQFEHFGEMKAISTVHHDACVSPETYNQAPNQHFCVVKMGTLYPKDTWHKKDPFSTVLRNLMYEKGLKYQPDVTPGLVPNIGHSIWLGGGRMDFLFYLSCLSFLHVLKVEKLYLHGDRPPRGEYWERLRTDPRVTFVKRIWPNLIYRSTLRVFQHMSDLARIDILNKYGGVYADVDAVFVKPIPDWLRRYGAVVSYDWPQMYNTYPDYINFGVILGKRGDPLFNKIIESMKNFKDNFYAYNGILKPYKLYERDPSIVYLYDRLQVLCWGGRCHPNWYPGWRARGASHLSGAARGMRWRDALAFHWTTPTPPELGNLTALLAGRGMYAEIGRHVLEQAGVLRQGRLVRDHT